jgi:hypothetical protein
VSIIFTLFTLLFGAFRLRNASLRPDARRVAQCDFRAGANELRFARTLEKRVSRTILPRKRTCEFFPRLERRIVNTGDQRFVPRVPCFHPEKLLRSVLAAKMTSTPSIAAIFSANSTPAGDSIIATIMMLSFACWR